MSKQIRFFRQLVAYTFPNDWVCPGIEDLEAALQKTPFLPTGATQQQSCGWVPPRAEEHAPMVEVIDGQILMRLRIETRKVPSAVVNAKVEERVKQILANEGRRAGKKEKKEIKEEVVLSLLPNAFPTNKTIHCWLDREKYRLIFDVGSVNATDVPVALLTEVFTGLKRTMMLRNLNTQQSAVGAMSAWLVSHEPPAGFSIDRDAQLSSSDESRAAVKYSHHPLDIEEVQEHIKQGKVPTQLAMTYDSRLSFVLTDAMTIKNIETLDTCFEDMEDDADFDSTVKLVTGEISNMLDALIEELGGLLVLSSEESKDSED